MTTAASNTEAVTSADPRVPFPPITAQTACRTEPDRWFPDRYGEDSIERHQAVNACKGCPLAEQCLLWALANPELTEHGIWAATTPRQRTYLRQSLRARLGRDWVAVVATRRRARTQAGVERRWGSRVHPAVPLTAASPVAAAAVPAVVSGPRNWEPVTPERAARNREILLAALRERQAA